MAIGQCNGRPGFGHACAHKSFHIKLHEVFRSSVISSSSHNLRWTSSTGHCFIRLMKLIWTCDCCLSRSLMGLDNIHPIEISFAIGVLWVPFPRPGQIIDAYSTAPSKRSIFPGLGKVGSASRNPCILFHDSYEQNSNCMNVGKDKRMEVLNFSLIWLLIDIGKLCLLPSYSTMSGGYGCPFQL